MSDPFSMTGGMAGGMAGMSYCSPLPKWIASLACCIVVGLVVTLIVINSQKSKARSELETCQRNKVSQTPKAPPKASPRAPPVAPTRVPTVAPTLVPAVVKTQNDTKKNKGKKNKGRKNRREGFLWF